MAIGIDISCLNRKYWTGTEWYVYYLIKNLSKIDRKNKYILYCRANKSLADDVNSSYFNSLVKNLPANFSIKILKWPFGKLWSMIRLSLEIFFNKPNVLFVPAHNLPIICPKKTIITWHDCAYEHYPELYTKFELFLLKFGIKKAIKKASKIIVPSEFTKSEMIKFYNINDKRIKVVHHGISPNFKQNNNVNLKNKFGKYLLYIGRLEKKKNVLGLLKVFKKLLEKQNNDLKLILVGKQGYGWQQIKEYIAKYKLSEKIIKLNYIKEEEKYSLLKNAQIFIFLSYYEGFGIPILEAMSVGCPVVCSNKGSLPEIAGKAAVLVDVLDIEKIAETVNKVLIDKELREELIINGYKRVKEFSWQKSAKKTLDIIELLSRSEH